jgi:cytochrome c-type biogenesis protein
VPIISAFLLGILGATAPCQLSTNLGAVGYLTNRSINREKLFKNTLWYTGGKLLTFLIYGLIIIMFKINFQQKFVLLFSFARKLTGPLIIIVGIGMLGMINFRFSLGSKITARLNFYCEKYKIFNPAFIMGIFFSLAFCPTLFWLFFGLAVPLAIKSSLGLIYPAIFALGTLIPMIIAITIIGFSKENNKNIIKKFRRIQDIIRILGGSFIIIFGVLDTIIYFFV